MHNIHSFTYPVKSRIDDRIRIASIDKGSSLFINKSYVTFTLTLVKHILEQV